MSKWKLVMVEMSEVGAWACFENTDPPPVGDLDDTVRCTIMFILEEREYRAQTNRQEEIIAGITPEEHARVIAACMVGR